MAQSRPRDTQRSRVYAAERAAFDRGKTEGLSVPEMQALVDKWRVSKVLRRRYPKAVRALRVTDGRSRRRGGHFQVAFGPDEIRMPRWTRSRWYLLHEFAHVLTHSDDTASHGWEFCACYLYLVRVYLGRGAEQLLLEQFRERRVKHRPPRTRRMSEEQREAARRRMLALHEKRREMIVA